MFLPHTTQQEREKNRKLECIIITHLQLCRPSIFDCCIYAAAEFIIIVIIIIIIGAATTVSTVTRAINWRLFRRTNNNSITNVRYRFADMTTSWCNTPHANNQVCCVAFTSAGFTIQLKRAHTRAIEHLTQHVLPLSRWCDTPKIILKTPLPRRHKDKDKKKYHKRHYIASRWSPCWSSTAAGGIIRKSVVLRFFWHPTFVHTTRVGRESAISPSSN